MDKFSKVEIYKITQKLDAFLNGHNDISERESRKQSKTALKNLEINLTKEVKDLYAKSQHC